MLHTNVVFARRRNHQLSLVRIVATGFFDIDMLASRSSHHCGGSVPVIATGDGQRIDLRILENFSKILPVTNCAPIHLADCQRRRSSARSIDIEHRLDLNTIQRLESRGDSRTASPHAHRSDDNLVVCAGFCGGSFGG